jgi:hypothetical protein
MNVAICDVYCCKESVWWRATVPDTEENRAMLTSMQGKDMSNDLEMTTEEQRLYSILVEFRERVEESELTISSDDGPDPTIDYSKYDFVLTNVIC